MPETPLEKYTALKTKVDRLQREADKAAGALEQLKAQLLKEFDCKSIEAAEALLAELEKEERDLDQKFTKALKVFEDKWGEHL